MRRKNNNKELNGCTTMKTIQMNSMDLVRED